ncbi:MAG: alpha/beta hydrolase [Actinobacteria bacterium]|nr:alpha/beta hydrolase [Actinomycetota bacterium]
MESIELSSGTIDYLDTGGAGTVIVLVGGVIMDATLWHEVVARLAPAHRCVVPVLPLGGHRRAMNLDADLSLHGIADLLAEFIERLELTDVILVAVDWGGPQLTAVRHPERLAGLVLLPLEAFDAIPPGLPGAFAGSAGRMPGGIFAAAQSLRIPFMRRLPMTFGRMAKRPIPKPIVTSWITGIRTDRRVRRDVAKYVRSTDNNGLNEAAVELAHFDRPTLVLWAAEDRVMPPEHGRRLADLIPGARYVEVDDSYTLLPLDQPDVVATHVAAFAAGIKALAPAAGASVPERPDPA